MEYVVPVITQIAVFFIIMIIGYTVGKIKAVPDCTESVISKLLSLIVFPVFCFNTMATNFTAKAFSEHWTILLYGLGAVLFSVGIALLLAPIFSKDRYTKSIYIYSFIISNMGYFGSPLIKAVFGDKVLSLMLLFIVAFNMYIYSFGYASLTNSSGSFIKKFINPVFIMLIIGIIIGICGIRLPAFILSASDSIGNCLGPLAMLVAGLVISKYNIGELLRNPRVWIASFLRLTVIPAVIVLLIKLCGGDNTVVIITLGTCAMPLGLNTVVFPASCGKDTSTGASMALISSLMCVITIPVMFMIFVK